MSTEGRQLSTEFRAISQNLMRLTHIMMHFRKEDLKEYFAFVEGAEFAIAAGRLVPLPEKFRQFHSTRDLIEARLPSANPRHVVALGNLHG